jgi:hypothetical protein
MASVKTDRLFDASRTLSAQYAKRVAEIQSAVRANAFLARLIPSVSDFRLLVAPRDSHPFAQTHPVANLAAIAPYVLQLESPLPELVATIKAVRCWYDWQRHESDPAIAEGRKQLQEGIDAWIGGRLDPGEDFEGAGFRRQTAERRWMEFSFPLEALERSASGDLLDFLILETQQKVERAFCRMLSAGNEMAAQLARRAAGTPFQEYLAAAFSMAVAGGGVRRATLSSEYMWIPRNACLELASDVPAFYALSSFSVADIFWRKMARREPPTGVGRSGLAGYVAMVCLGVDRWQLQRAFGADTASVANAEALLKVYRSRVEEMLGDLGRGTVAGLFRRHEIPLESMY